MKNLSIILNAVLGVAVLVLYILFFTSSNNGSGTQNPPVSVEIKGKKEGIQPIVYVNTDSLLLNYEFAKKARKELEGKQATIQTDLESRGKQLEAEIQTFQKTYTSMSVQQAQNTEKALGQKQQDLLNYRDIVGRQYLEEEQKLNEKLFNNVQDYLKRYAAEKGHVYIMGYTKVNPIILYAEASLDITKEVLKGLNDEYKEKGTK